MKRTTYAVIGVIVAIALVVSVVVVWILPMFAAPREIRIELVEFAYERPNYNPTYTIKAGETVHFILTNKGGAEHEFMIVEDKDLSQLMTDEAIQELLADQNLTTGQRMMRFHDIHHEMGLEYQGLAVELDVGQTLTLVVKIDEPGVYYIVCHKVQGTWPNTHLAVGMWATLIVEAS